MTNERAKDNDDFRGEKGWSRHSHRKKRNGLDLLKGSYLISLSLTHTNNKKQSGSSRRGPNGVGVVWFPILEISGKRKIGLSLSFSPILVIQVPFFFFFCLPLPPAGVIHVEGKANDGCSPLLHAGLPSQEASPRISPVSPPSAYLPSLPF